MKVRSLFLLTVVGVACTRQPATVDLGPAPASKADAGLSDRVSNLEGQLFYLEYRVGDLESEDASVNTEEDVYGVARTKFGPFTVLNKGVTPYLDGFKIKLAVGNLTNATFHGAKLKVTWGPKFDKAHPADSRKNQKHHDFDLTTILNPGSYSIADVTLTPAKPDEIKSISVGIELNVLSLRGR